MLYLIKTDVTALRDVLPIGRDWFSLRGKYSVVKQLDPPTYKASITTHNYTAQHNTQECN
jgi:hypothetical protein